MADKTLFKLSVPTDVLSHILARYKNLGADITSSMIEKILTHFIENDILFTWVGGWTLEDLYQCLHHAEYFPDIGSLYESYIDIFELGLEEEDCIDFDDKSTLEIMDDIVSIADGVLDVVPLGGEEDGYWVIKDFRLQNQNQDKDQDQN